MSTINDRTDNGKTNEAGEQTGDEQSTATILRPMTDDERRTMGLSAIGFFRKMFADEGLSAELERALTTLETRVMNPNAPSEEAPPEGPSTERTTPPTSSRFAIRDDGALLLSLEDAEARDVTGCTVIPFMLLTGDDDARARRVMDLALSDVAAKVIGALPMKAPKL